MARWFYNRPSEKCDETEIKVANKLRHLSINRAKGLDALAVIMVGAEPFQKIRKVDNQYTYFMGASRAKQMLAIVHGSS